MRRMNKIPSRLPKYPTLIREQPGSYVIWTGRNWHGSVNRVRGGWMVTTPSAPCEVFSTFKSASQEADGRAWKAEGKTLTDPSYLVA